MQRILFFCLIELLSLHVCAQKPNVKALQIGDTMPDIPFQEFLDTSTPKLQLAGLKGKLVILDFWNVGCLACLQSMPKMASLQKQFGERIQIIFITNNTKAEVERLFGRIKIQKPQLPFVVADTTYYQTLFPHVGDPLHVWINEKGVISAITDGYNATITHIQSMLDGKKTELSVRAPAGPFIGTKGLLQASVGPLKDFVYSYSILLKNIHRQTTSTAVVLQRDSTTRKLQKIKAINTPLVTLYSYAYSKELFGFEVNVRNLPRNNRIVVKTANPLDVRWPTADSVMDAWNERNLWTYEAEVTPSSEIDLLSVLQSDLDKYSRFMAKVEVRTMKCLVLKRTSRTDKLCTGSKTKAPEAYFNDAFIVQNMTLQASLLPHLVVACQEMPYPVVDETNYTEPVDLKLRVLGNSIKDWNKALQQYDLALDIENRQTNVLVIQDKKYSSN